MAVRYEPFPNWLEEGKIFEDVGLSCSVSLTPSIQEAPSQTTTQNLWQEFEHVLYAMPQGTLTPPQSPPRFAILETITAPQKQVQYSDQEQQFLNEVLSYTQPPLDLQSDVAHELAVVDELIRARAENLIDCPSSPCSSSSDFSSDDPEWIPETVESSSDYESTPVKSETRKRTKPYTRAPNEDRKSRKKEQNKNAATRYRMKKKAEVEVILKEENELAKQNDGYENQIKELQREIKYLKSLMRDVFKAKGLLD